MTVKLRPVLTTIRGYLAASARFPGGAGIGEPKDAPTDVYGCVMLNDYGGEGTTLTGSIETRTVTIRVYINALREPRDEIECLMDDICAELHAALLGDFDLGAVVRNIKPMEMTVRFGYQTVGGTMFRTGDLAVPMVVDDNATFAA